MEYNLLLDKLPQITPSGLKIRTDFRECIKFEILMQDNNISEKEKINLALNLFYYDYIDNVEEALNDILWFYSCNSKKENKQGKESNNKQIYSYVFDDKYIYSAFMQQYNIDLNKGYIHWWKFKALFQGLNENTQIVKIMGYRSMDISKIKDKEEKARYKKLQTIYALPDMRTTEQKESDFGKAFW